MDEREDSAKYDQIFWDDRYSKYDYCYGKEPNTFLLENYQAIVEGGRVLCLSEGEGRNAVFLASKGYRVTAVDLSSKAREKALRFAIESETQIEYDVADLKDYDLGEQKWDGIISISAHLPSELRRSLHISIRKGLAMSGVFLLEGYNKRQLEFNSGGPKNEDLLFSKTELEKDFSGFSIVLSQERLRDVSEGEFHRGEASVTQFIVRK